MFHKYHKQHIYHNFPISYTVITIINISFSIHTTPLDVTFMKIKPRPVRCVYYITESETHSAFSLLYNALASEQSEHSKMLL